uniref:Uncharacterized protein n=1 Tax=Zea mays TaxID=4577 RepID=C4J176_MAIZE|nr:unknown [Zea mays]
MSQHNIKLRQTFCTLNIIPPIPRKSQQENANPPEDTAQPFYRQDMVSLDSSASTRSLLRPTGAFLIQPGNHPLLQTSYTPQNS